MNPKTYCPLGKIDCESYAIEDRNCNSRCRHGWLHCETEVCPFPSKQQEIERYDMCEDQPAQINCTQLMCLWCDCYKCKNVSPAIQIKVFSPSVCLSYKEKP